MTRILGPSVLVLGLAACDAPLDPEPLSRDMRGAELDEATPAQGPDGPWPPAGGTLNTASLGVTPLMRLLPPDLDREESAEKDDGVISLIEVFDGDQYLPVTAVAVPQGTLVLHTAEGSFEGSETIGSRWWLDEEQTHYVTITDVSEGGMALGYQLEHHVATDGRVQLICAPDIDGDHWAYLVEDVRVNVSNGTISPDDGPLLVACASGALGKAITWGFTPWSEGTTEPLLLYQTGVRTVMADYCGDGSSYTEDGTLIQVNNALAAQQFVSSKANTEAVFGPDGALCLSSPRVPDRPMECTLSPCHGAPYGWVTADYHTWTKLAPP